ncbi:MAG: DUF6329 domain-containing protein [Synergistaceae bacterium]|nr:DUF6329 domain-containing protein [Synergistaceae bacterium]
MISLFLTRGRDDDGAFLKLPATPTEISKVFAELDATGLEPGSTQIQESSSNVYNLNRYIKDKNVEVPGVLDALNRLAEKMQTMDRAACLKFEGMLDANSINGIDDILRLTESMSDYVVLPDACSGSALGKYLVNHGFGGFPEAVRPYLDYQIIGSEFDAEAGGAFCRSGYVVRKDALPDQMRQSEQELPNHFAIALQLRANDGGATATHLSLPATNQMLEQAKQSLGIDDFAEVKITMVDYPLPYLAQMIPQDCITVEDANELALAIEEMQQNDSALLRFLSVLDVEQPDTFTEAYHLALNLDDYERVSNDPAEYGREVLERIGADEELLNTIDGFTDFDELGKFYMHEDGVVQTEFGALRRLSYPFETQAQSELSLQ